MNKKRETHELEEVTEEQIGKLYKCSHCGWIGTIDEMERDTDCGDPYDAVWSDFCCPNPGCWQWYPFLEDWDEV